MLVVCVDTDTVVQSGEMGVGHPGCKVDGHRDWDGEERGELEGVYAGVVITLREMQSLSTRCTSPKNTGAKK